MQKLSVKNFGPIKNATIEVNALTVLIGEHASGKSTLAKLVYYFKSIKKDLVELARLDPNEINQIKVLNTLREKFYLYFGSTRRLADDFSVQFYFDEKKYIRLEGSPLRVQLSPSNWASTLADEIRDAAPAVNFFRSRNEFEAALNAEEKLDHKLCEFLGDYTEPFFIPAGRNITTSYPQNFLDTFFQQLPQLTAPKIDEEGNMLRNDAQKINLYLIREFIGKTSLWKEVFKGEPFASFLRNSKNSKLLLGEVEKLLKGSYRVNDRQGEHLVLSDGKVIFLENASSGQQESIRIIQDVILSIFYGKAVFRVIEEPEAHLFPSGQESIIKLLVGLLNSFADHDSKNQSCVLITTHSPYFLSIINNMILAGMLNDAPRNDDDVAKAGFHPIFRLLSSQVSAYMISADGDCHSINHSTTESPEWGMIGGNVLEDFWNTIQTQFDNLMEVEPN
jgi:AAA ATPase domain